MARRGCRRSARTRCGNCWPPPPTTRRAERAMACHCDDYTKAQAGRGLRGIEPGMPTPAGTGLNRRAFLARSGGLALSVFGGTMLSRLAFEEGIAAAAGASSPVLVSIFLAGGLDSLSVLAPIGDPKYAEKRPNLKLAASGNPDDVFTE